jgi:hypothetical protein
VSGMFRSCEWPRQDTSPHKRQGLTQAQIAKAMAAPTHQSCSCLQVQGFVGDVAMERRALDCMRGAHCVMKIIAHVPSVDHRVPRHMHTPGKLELLPVA